MNELSFILKCVVYILLLLLLIVVLWLNIPLWRMLNLAFFFVCYIFIVLKWRKAKKIISNQINFWWPFRLLHLNIFFVCFVEILTKIHIEWITRNSTDKSILWNDNDDKWLVLFDLNSYWSSSSPLVFGFMGKNFLSCQKINNRN